MSKDMTDAELASAIRAHTSLINTLAKEAVKREMIVTITVRHAEVDELYVKVMTEVA